MTNEDIERVLDLALDLTRDYVAGLEFDRRLGGCCGDRWCTPYDDGSESPSSYGEPIRMLERDRWSSD